jgi:hypothetical protein
MKYNAYCIRTGYNDKFIDYLKTNKFNNTYVTSSKERIVNADEYDIEYVLEHLELYFDTIIVEKSIKKYKINNYKKIKEENGYIFFKKEEKEKTPEMTNFLLKGTKEIDKEAFVNILEEKIINSEYINKIGILYKEGQWLDINELGSIFKTNNKIFIVKISVEKQYNNTYVIFNVELGLVEVLYFSKKLIEVQIKKYLEIIKDFEEYKTVWM